MDLVKSGNLLRNLRKQKGFTQKQVADKLGVLPKTVSKWETGKGFPDVSVVSELAEILEVSEKILLTGNLTQNKTETGNMKKIKFFVCPCCGSFVQGTGEYDVNCCGISLKQLAAKTADEEHMANISVIENDFYVEFNHHMTKEHFITFVSYAGVDRVLTIRLYPEQSACARFPKMFGGKLYFYCNNHGLFEQKC